MVSRWHAELGNPRPDHGETLTDPHFPPTLGGASRLFFGGPAVAANAAICHDRPDKWQLKQRMPQTRVKAFSYSEPEENARSAFSRDFAQALDVPVQGALTDAEQGSRLGTMTAGLLQCRL